MLIPLDPDTLEAADIFEAELVVVIAAAFNAELEEAATDFLETFPDRFDKLLSLVGICCLISCILSIAFVSLVALIKCKFANDSFFKLPPARMLFEAVNMALLDEVNEELFLIDEAEPPPLEGAKLGDRVGVEAIVSLYCKNSPGEVLLGKTAGSVFKTDKFGPSSMP